LAKPVTYALVGAAGYVAPRHMKAIKATGGALRVAFDPHDAVGVIDQHFPEAEFFTEFERYDRHVSKLAMAGDALDRVAICSPNYLHDAHVRHALRADADAICEKPLVLPWNLDALADLEAEYGRRVHAVLQLRLIEKLQALREEIRPEPAGRPHDVCLSYVTRRGAWYDVSWKGDARRSGGVSMNIGVHFFDLLLWLFGEAGKVEVHLHEPRVELERARVRWFLSVDEKDLPESVRAAGKFAHRSMTLDGEEIEFSDGFTDLHTRVYREVLAGRGFGIEDARPAIELVHRINAVEVQPTGSLHPNLADRPARRPRAVCRSG